MNLTAEQIIENTDEYKNIKNNIKKDDKPSKKTFYWTTTKEEFVHRLTKLPTVYHRDIWNYLHAYIIRGAGSGSIWTACYNVFKSSSILASSVGIKKISQELNISHPKVISILKELDENNYIIKYSSMDNDINNTNIYIMGFQKGIIETKKSTIYRDEIYLTNVLNKMTDEQRKRIVELYDKQLGIEIEINTLYGDILQIQKELFDVGSK